MYAELTEGTPFTLAGARARGCSAKALRGLVAKQEVRRVIQGVYVAAWVPDTIEIRARALSLVVPSGAAVCRSAAAWMHGIDARPIGQVSRDPPLEVLVEASRSIVERRGIRGYSAVLLEPTEIIEVAGCRVTTTLRTVVDLARVLGRLEAVATLDQFLHAGLVDLGQFRAEVPRFAGHRGAVQLRFAASVAEPLAESPGESWTRVELIDSGLPRPRAQIELRGIDGTLFHRLDLGYDEVRLGVEYMGIRDHAGVENRARDEGRERSIERDFGWCLVNLWSDSVLGRRPTAPRQVAEALLTRGFWLPDSVLEGIAHRY